ncbi:hypothetical protein Tsubulata_024047 [Turnera subulata]|uniref:NAC domain-containing protein n=1 Tax=Turnera subulata TaxID=218843 RepID=A0A9Q0G6P3_9ROSI|nr:hypothetical protein Tsubulata_024047 [Turnera subulata]
MGTENEEREKETMVDHLHQPSCMVVPVGSLFRPSITELAGYYLYRQLHGQLQPLDMALIQHHDIYREEPWEIWDSCRHSLASLAPFWSDPEHVYFFATWKHKSPTDKRKLRVNHGGGTWHGETGGTTTEILIHGTLNKAFAGEKKFTYKNPSYPGRTWTLTEYSLDPQAEPNSVICRINETKKSSYSKKRNSSSSTSTCNKKRTKVSNVHDEGCSSQLSSPPILENSNNINHYNDFHQCIGSSSPSVVHHQEDLGFSAPLPLLHSPPDHHHQEESLSANEDPSSQLTPVPDGSIPDDDDHPREGEEEEMRFSPLSIDALEHLDWSLFPDLCFNPDTDLDDEPVAASPSMHPSSPPLHSQHQEASQLIEVTGKSSNAVELLQKGQDSLSICDINIPLDTEFLSSAAAAAAFDDDRYIDKFGSHFWHDIPALPMLSCA